MKGKSHSRRLRIGRFSEHGRVYLVTSRLEKYRSDFADWRLGRLLVHELREAQHSGLAQSLAWVVMPDHFHWLVELRTGSLSAVVQRVKSKTAIAVNSATGRQGRLWQWGFHDKAVRDEKDLLMFARYIVANPLRAGLVKRVGDYPLWDAVWLDGAG
jgi:REP element-mobilizing transposase RayT